MIILSKNEKYVWATLYKQGLKTGAINSPSLKESKM